MARESFRERNRRRREESALNTLYAYARSAGIAEPKRSAERAARALHSDGADRGNARMRRSSPDGSAEGSTGAATEAGERVPHRLDDRTKEQLYTRAQELDIAGRSQMNKDELIDAIRENS